ncbi:hypothetical protein Scep_010875 [Stephania cephalantha]|uniref:Uncharacterized protein n=1 Tax=Stephania cephalantha TaxID=152367 RepID=A0AAP0JWN9_9MAGN
MVTMDTTNYSSPMPAIGLYIAGATLVCLLLMLCDVVNGIRRRKPWIPCHFFVLNSFTLALVSVATKLSVDLTTSMPSAYDQLSKLCGTAFICISIGFFRPSIVNMNESELSANLASLTVIVITVAVNISMQITTVFSACIDQVALSISLKTTACLGGGDERVPKLMKELRNEPVSDLSTGYSLQKSSRDMKMFIAKHSAHPVHSPEKFLGRTGQNYSC